jgi:hypothetical protein
MLATTVGFALGLATADAQSGGPGQTVLVAKQVGTAWKVEGGSGEVTGSTVTLKSGERMILVDKRGIRQFRGPAAVELTARDGREGLFEISYRALRSQASERQNTQVRGSASEQKAEVGKETGPTVLEPRDKPLVS